MSNPRLFHREASSFCHSISANYHLACEFYQEAFFQERNQSIKWKVYSSTLMREFFIYAAAAKQ